MQAGRRNQRDDDKSFGKADEHADKLNYHYEIASK